MKIKTSELSGPALDWAVATCEGFKQHASASLVIMGNYVPSTDWAQGGPIIEREGFSLEEFKGIRGDWRCFDFKGGHVYAGKTPLIAAMRCYVASKLGDEVDVPEELVK